MYTFDTFRIDGTNRFAHAAAHAVAEVPGRAYNPLWIYGCSGTGKTHLLGAIERKVAQDYPGTIVAHVSLMNPYALDRRLDQAQVLLIDDAEHLRSSCIMFEQFNEVVTSTVIEGGQVIVASKMPYECLHFGCCAHPLPQVSWWLEVDMSGRSLIRDWPA
ncbi:Chromosomal replication initiator protein DnaA [Rhodococcus sp. B10]|nr:Chromosomal replication initiator protein DnaA [Rhodococcus sp. B10]